MEQRFSERMGITPARTVLQVDGMESALRTSIWNLLLGVFDAREAWRHAAGRVAIGFLKVPVNEVPTYNEHRSRDWLYGAFFDLSWYEVYDLLEFLVPKVQTLGKGGMLPESFMKLANVILEREGSGYRFAGGQLTRISSEAEVSAIEEALAKAAGAGLGGVETHLREALRLLGLRPTPSYRNSAKEAISAVESAVKCISGVSGGGVEDALEALSKKTPIHGALKAGLVKLYGYTSDEGGIRHAILEESNVGYDEAKFMVVTCSAFAYFLISKAEAVGLLKAGGK